MMKNIYLLSLSCCIVVLLSMCSDPEDVNPEEEISEGFEEEQVFFDITDKSDYSVNGNPQEYTTNNGLGYIFNDNAGVAFCDSTSDYLSLGTIGAVWENGFTVVGRAQFEENRNYERIVDFGNGTGMNFGYNIALSRLDSSNDLTLSSWINEKYDDVQGVTAHDVIKNGEMTFFAATISPEGMMKIYVNNELVASKQRQPIVNIERTNNYIARSNWCHRDPDFKGKIENLLIYNRDLNSAEVSHIYQEQTPQ